MPGVFGIYDMQCKYEANEHVSYMNNLTNILNHNNRFDFDVVSTKKFCTGIRSFKNNKNSENQTCYFDNSVIIMIDGNVYSCLQNGYQTYLSHNEGLPAIIFNLYKDFGDKPEKLSKMLNGEYNIVIFDSKIDLLLVFNDTWGFREFFYYFDNNLFLFSPEIKAILDFNGINTTMNFQAAYDYLRYGYILCDHTFLNEINLLPPGGWIVVKNGQISTGCSNFDIDKPIKNINIDDACTQAFDFLEKAVSRRLISERCKVISYLSGGLDSRMISAILYKNNALDTLLTISSGKYGFEYLIAKEVAKEFNGIKHILATTSSEHILKHLDWSVWASDGMLSITSISPYFGASINTVTDHEMIFGGFVGDLILGGSYTRIDDSSRFTRNDKIEKLKHLAGHGTLESFWDCLFTDSFKKKISYYEGTSIEQAYNRLCDSTDNFALQQELFIILSRCRRNFNGNRGLISHSGAEEFYPFFDEDLIDFLYSLPINIRAQHKLYFEIFKKYFPKLANIRWLKTGANLYSSPSKIYENARDFFDKFKWHMQVWSGGKCNISDPWVYTQPDIWYRTDDRLNNHINSILNDNRTRQRGFFDMNGVNKLLEHTKKGFDNFKIIERLLAFELWCRFFIDKDTETHGYSKHN